MQGPVKVAFYLIDVFSTEPLAGNPLALVPDAGSLDDEVMRRIAREFNQAETTFLVPPTKAEADWRLRCFTAAGTEVFGAGHNSLGAWWWLAASGRLALNGSGGRFMQEIGPRVLPVEVARERDGSVSIGLTQTGPVFGEFCNDYAELSAALGIEVARGPLPVQVVSTGAAHLMVPVRERAAIAYARPDHAQLAALLRGVKAQGAYLFSLDPVDPASAAHTRFFNPVEGIAEDAATGSAAGPLASYLVAQGIAKHGADLVIEQGYAMGRPSLIRVRVSGETVQIFGRGFRTAEGTLTTRKGN